METKPAENEATARSTKESKSSGSSPRLSPRLRTLSWSYWLILATILGTLVFYFIRRGNQVKAVAIAPTTLLDGRIGFTPSTAFETLRNLGTKGREIYIEINRVDFVLTPIVLREFLLNTFPATTSKSDSVRELFANTYMLGDVLENVGVAILLKAYPKELEYVAWICCVGNLAKWFGFYASTVAILYEIFVWIRATKVKKE
jgi:hypothetical protein